MTILKECPREVTFDLAARAEYQDPERMERTVYVSPLTANVTPDIVKKMFYSKKCGAIKSVTIERHRKKKTSFAKAKYALVEFAHKDSVEVCGSRSAIWSICSTYMHMHIYTHARTHMHTHSWQ